LSFLDGGGEYNVLIYSDGENAHWDKNPTAYKIENKIVSSTDAMELKLAPGGGTAISFIPLIK
jgi:hypothetical protein